MAITRLGPNQDITAAKIAGTINFKNLIINGDMSLAQRDTSVTGLQNSPSYLIDRFSYRRIGTWTTAQYTMSQDTDVPTGQGFAKSLKIDVTTAEASAPNDAASQISQRIEGQNLQMLKKGTSNAESTTLSFWVKSNKTGTYIAELKDTDNSRTISKAYTIDSASTWEKKTLTFEGDTTGAFDNDNDVSLEILWWLASGTNYTSGTLQTSWGSEIQANRAVGQVNLADDTANEWYITGVQLEADTSASDFEFLPYDVNLKRCLRYFEKSYTITTAPATDTEAGSISLNGLNESSKQVRTHDTRYTTQKRSSPTITIYDKTGNSGKFSTFNAGGARADNVSYNGIITTNQNSFDLYKESTTIAGYQFHYTADAEL